MKYNLDVEQNFIYIEIFADDNTPLATIAFQDGSVITLGLTTFAPSEIAKHAAEYAKLFNAIATTQFNLAPFLGQVHSMATHIGT